MTAAGSQRLAPRAAGGEVCVAAPAKLNLYLHVTGRRADGYHFLDSLVAFAGVHDTLILREAAEIALAVEGPFAGALADVPDNIVLRAARMLREAAGVAAGVHIRLIKRLPVAAGIGGGSADAGAALRGLVRLWGLKLGEVELARLALSLGADVPVCLAGRAAFVGGIGEEIVPAPALPPARLVLVNPGVRLATADVFAARQGPYSAAARFFESPRHLDALALRLAERRNDLADAAIRLCPAISRAVGALVRAPGCRLARMSGSGATCFGLFAEEAAAARAAADIAAAEPAWWVAAAPLVAETAALVPAR